MVTAWPVKPVPPNLLAGQVAAALGMTAPHIQDDVLQSLEPSCTGPSSACSTSMPSPAAPHRQPSRHRPPEAQADLDKDVDDILAALRD